jgi:hypothetical protein
MQYDTVMVVWIRYTVLLIDIYFSTIDNYQKESKVLAYIALLFNWIHEQNLFFSVCRIIDP